MPNQKPVYESVSSLSKLAIFSGKVAPYAAADAFRRLYEHTHVAVYRYIYSLHGGPAEDVEDLTAETFERAWKGRNRFYGDEDAAIGWLITIARNLVIDALRRHQRREVPSTIDNKVLEIPAETAIERYILQDEQQAVLVAALQTLPIQEREMVILRYVLGWQVKRIASHYDILENTISVKIRRALEHLRRQLSHSAEI